MECTFKPQINHRRGGGEDFKDSSCDRFEQLFLDAESRRRRQAEYVQWYPEGLVHFMYFTVPLQLINYSVQQNAYTEVLLQ